MSDTSTGATFPWPPASATGVGSLPGTDPAEAMRLIVGEFPDLPHLAELPGRGPGADLTGRSAALLVDLPVETVPGGWRFAGREGRDLRRARAMLGSDLDAMEEAAAGYQGPLKIQVAGPWTLASTIELARSQDFALADRGAVADLIASLAEGVRAHVDEVRKRVPGARLLVQFDEPVLPAVLAGAVPTASGLHRVPALPGPEAQAGLGTVISRVGEYAIVHCCAAQVPFGVIAGAGAQGVSFDLAVLPAARLDELAAAVEDGLGILAGVVPAVPPAGRGAPGPGSGVPGSAAARGAVPPAVREVAERVIDTWRRMGWPSPRRGGRHTGPASLPAQMVLTPACGLAGAAPSYARTALARCRDAARMVPELIEESR